MLNDEGNTNIVGRFCETPRRLTQTLYNAVIQISFDIRHSTFVIDK
jgi:hypothetical protein